MSMPLIGRYSFLQENPHRKSAFMNLVSMPLIRRYSFLPCFCCRECGIRGNVSMPLIGRYSFLQVIGDENYMALMCVNALNRANPISTERQDLRCGTGIGCVNALSRANPISTLPFWNRLI